MQYFCLYIVLFAFYRTLAISYIDAAIAPQTSCARLIDTNSRNATCKIECNTGNSGGISHTIDCGKIDTCIIHCTARMCLQHSRIIATEVSSLTIVSSASNCLTNSDIYLPDAGDVSIFAYFASSAFSSNTLHAGASTNSISIHCIGNGKAINLCNDLYLDASDVHRVHLTVTSTSANGAYIICPEDTNGECIINATHAISLQNATVIAPQRVTLYIGKKTDLSNSILECEDDAVMRYDLRDDYYYGECLRQTMMPSTTAVAATTDATTVSYTADSTDSLSYSMENTDYNGNTNYNGNSSSDMAHIEPWEIMVGRVHNTGYLMIILLIGTPLLLVTLAAIYNVRFKGSDPPNFSLILKCFMNTADFYIDIIFCVLLLIKWSSLLFVCCVLCISISHLISNCMALYYIHKWSKKNILYIQEYKVLVVGLSLTVGFYAAIQLLSSKLFYLMPFSMQLSNEQVYRIQILTICNDALFRNIPVIAIAVLSVVWNTLENTMDIITTIAFISSLFMLITGSLTLLSRCISTRCRFKYNFVEDSVAIDVILTSDTIQTHHRFCHRVFADAVALSLGIASDRVETLLITPAEGGNGICCNVEILLIDDEQKVYRCIEDIQNNWDDAMYNFKTALCKALYIIEVDVDVIIVRDNRDSQSMPHHYKPLTQKGKHKEIEIVKVSTSLNEIILSRSGEGGELCGLQTDAGRDSIDRDDHKYNDDSDCESTS